MGRYDKSMKMLARLRACSPGGAQTLSKRAERFPEGAFPVALKYGNGPYVTDVDGHKYLDMICGLAAMTLGYDNFKVYDAASEQLRDGVTFSLATELEAEVAEKIIDMVPCAEQVRFVKTGSEATEAAIRIARKATGRDIILTVGSGYHSWHSWFQAIKPQHPGIPTPYEWLTWPVQYNDLDEMKTAVECWFDEVEQRICEDIGGVAAIILEPCHYEHPNRGYLQGLRNLCTKNDIVLIFDEMVTGFRWANGGAQEYFGVTPDLATFGKACANGFPLAFVCGKQELMQHADVVSGTFGGEALSLAACSAVLDVYKQEPIVETLWKRGRQFQDGVNAAINDLDLSRAVVCDGFAVKPRIRFKWDDLADRIDLMRERNNLALSLFVQELAAHGVLWHPAGGNISAAMTERDIELAVDTVRAALYVTRTALTSGDWSALKGKPIQASTFVRTP
jgi:glutamate-1-semialdehyde aminotransferase